MMYSDPIHPSHPDLSLSHPGSPVLVSDTPPFYFHGGGAPFLLLSSFGLGGQSYFFLSLHVHVCERYVHLCIHVRVCVQGHMPMSDVVLPVLAFMEVCVLPL